MSDSTENVNPNEETPLPEAPVVVSDPLPSKPERKKADKDKAASPVEKVYKLNMRRNDGQMRGEISKATLMTVAAQWGDLIRSIPSNRFSTMEEIVQAVWEAEKRSYLKGHPRSRKQIEEGVRHMVAHGVIIERDK